MKARAKSNPERGTGVPLSSKSGLPTLKDVGRKAGVCASTASMSLREDPRIPKATRERVVKAARALGYVPDPMLAALVSRRRNLQSSKRRTLANIAILLDDRWLLEKQEWAAPFFRGVEEACRQFGYQPDFIHIQRDLVPHPHPDRLLASRGIRGIVIFPTCDSKIVIPLNWNLYSVATISTKVDDLQFYHVSPDVFTAMTFVCEKVCAMGYRRIGLAHLRIYEERSDYGSVGSLSKEAFRRPGITIVPPHLPEGEREEEKPLRLWLDRHRPDCVLTNSLHVFRLLSKMRKIPEELGVVTLSRGMKEMAALSGIAQHLDMTAEVAVKCIHQMILRGETGLTDLPCFMRIPPVWVDGATTRPQRPLSDRA